ncbi:hypothetical protein NDI52_30040 [Leptolyngbya sp. PL-A3]|uniref:hypothetical protein n=1 Tax=Leptolyngbya sp. PL-A3 TaxID=2933911 RepID=UPI0032985856
MEEDGLKSRLETLKRTLDETKALLEKHQALLLESFFRIEELGIIAGETKNRAAAALEQLIEDPNDAIAQQVLKRRQALIEPLREALNQDIAEHDYHLSKIHTTTNAIKVAERMFIEFSTDPGVTHY